MIFFREESMKGDTARGIRAIIKRRGLVQKAVAARAGMSAQKLNDMLAGRATIHADDMPLIAEALGVRIEDIYYYAAKEKASQRGNSD